MQLCAGFWLSAPICPDRDGETDKGRRKETGQGAADEANDRQSPRCRKDSGTRASIRISCRRAPRRHV